jgi:metal-dependent amidase/aminoacylase/carboxypeptidase family protein
VAKVVPVLKSELGDSNVEEVEPTMGAEDFGLFGQGGVPTFMFRLGTIPPARVAEAHAKGEPLPSLHSALYHPDPAPSLRVGLRAMTAAVVSLLPPGGHR